ncbi:MAG: GntP family permease [Hyphomicrobiales bacterium]|nr:GntP family permease [Hyphomicrobiales bacterium]
MTGIAGIILSLVLLMYLAYRGINVLLLAPICATIAVIFAGDLPLMATYTQIFMIELGKYLAKFFPLFMLGAIFGKLMDDSGSAKVIAGWIANKVGAKRALLAIVLACGILTYGGVSLFVVAFAVYPVGAALLRSADTPKRLLPGAIALGSFTFTMTALPGTPSIQNAIPAPFFGTTTFAAPGLGIIGALIMVTLGMLWLSWRAGVARKRSEGYGEHDEASTMQTSDDENTPSIWVALLPIVVVIGLNYLFSKQLFPAMAADYLADPKYGSTKLSAVLGIWAIIAALIVACLVAVALNWKRYGNLVDSINKGTFGAMLPIFNTASEVGYGSVIASLPAFLIVRDAMTHITSSATWSTFMSVNVLAGITGSASGGMSIALTAVGETLVQEANALGINLEILHRVAAMSSGGFDSLPHNGAVITLLAICGLTHRQSYVDIFVCSVVTPVFATLTVIFLSQAFGAF